MRPMEEVIALPINELYADWGISFQQLHAALEFRTVWHTIAAAGSMDATGRFARTAVDEPPISRSL